MVGTYSLARFHASQLAGMNRRAALPHLGLVVPYPGDLGAAAWLESVEPHRARIASALRPVGHSSISATERVSTS